MEIYVIHYGNLYLFRAHEQECEYLVIVCPNNPNCAPMLRRVNCSSFGFQFMGQNFVL